jgi:hypothetical protein
MRLLGGGEIDVEGLGLEMETVKGDAGEVKDEGDPPLFLLLRFFLLLATGLPGGRAPDVCGRATSVWTSLGAVGEDGAETRSHCKALTSSDAAVVSPCGDRWSEEGGDAVSVRAVATVTFLALWLVETDSQSLSSVISPTDGLRANSRLSTSPVSTAISAGGKSSSSTISSSD